MDSSYINILDENLDVNIFNNLQAIEEFEIIEPSCTMDQFEVDKILSANKLNHVLREYGRNSINNLKRDILNSKDPCIIKNRIFLIEWIDGLDFNERIWFNFSFICHSQTYQNSLDLYEITILNNWIKKSLCNFLKYLKLKEKKGESSFYNFKNKLVELDKRINFLENQKKSFSCSSTNYTKNKTKMNFDLEKLKVLTWNPNSINMKTEAGRNNVFLLKENIKISEPHIITIQETRAKLKDLPKLEGFDLYASEFAADWGIGGTCMYINQEVDLKPCQLIVNRDDILILLVNRLNQRLIVRNVYIKPSDNYQTPEYIYQHLGLVEDWITIADSNLNVNFKFEAHPGDLLLENDLDPCNVIKASRNVITKDSYPVSYSSGAKRHPLILYEIDYITEKKLLDQDKIRILAVNREIKERNIYALTVSDHTNKAKLSEAASIQEINLQEDECLELDTPANLEDLMDQEKIMMKKITNRNAFINTINRKGKMSALDWKSCLVLFKKSNLLFNGLSESERKEIFSEYLKLFKVPDNKFYATKNLELEFTRRNLWRELIKEMIEYLDDNPEVWKKIAKETSKHSYTTAFDLFGIDQNSFREAIYKGANTLSMKVANLKRWLWYIKDWDDLDLTTRLLPIKKDGTKKEWENNLRPLTIYGQPLMLISKIINLILDPYDEAYGNLMNKAFHKNHGIAINKWIIQHTLRDLNTTSVIQADISSMYDSLRWHHLENSAAPKLLKIYAKLITTLEYKLDDDNLLILKQGITNQGDPCAPRISNFCMRAIVKEIYYLTRTLWPPQSTYTSFFNKKINGYYRTALINLYVDDMVIISRMNGVQTQNLLDEIIKKLNNLNLTFNPRKFKIMSKIEFDWSAEGTKIFTSQAIKILGQYFDIKGNPEVNQISKIIDNITKDNRLNRIGISKLFIQYNMASLNLLTPAMDTARIMEDIKNLCRKLDYKGISFWIVSCILKPLKTAWIHYRSTRKSENDLIEFYNNELGIKMINTVKALMSLTENAEAKRALSKLHIELEKDSNPDNLRYLDNSELIDEVRALWNTRNYKIHTKKKFDDWKAWAAMWTKILFLEFLCTAERRGILIEDREEDEEEIRYNKDFILDIGLKETKRIEHWLSLYEDWKNYIQEIKRNIEKLFREENPELSHLKINPQRILDKLKIICKSHRWNTETRVDITIKRGIRTLINTNSYYLGQLAEPIMKVTEQWAKGINFIRFVITKEPFLNTEVQNQEAIISEDTGNRETPRVAQHNSEITSDLKKFDVRNKSVEWESVIRSDLIEVEEVEKKQDSVKTRKKIRK